MMTRTTRSVLPPAFWRLWVGESVSSFGTYVTLLALQVLVLVTLHGDAEDVGWLSSARWLPFLVLGLLAGTLVERRRRRPVMVMTDLACAVVLGVIPLAWALGWLSLPLLLVIVFLFGTASLINDAASMAFLPRMVPGRQLQQAHARLDGSDAVAQTTGPALSGVLIQLLGAPLAVLVDAGSYLFSAVMMGSLRVEEAVSSGPTPGAGIRHEIAEGIRWIYRGSSLRALAVGTHVWFAANAILGVAVPTFALQTLRLSVLQFSISTTMAGVGAVTGASVTTAVGRRLGTGRTVIAAHTITVVGVCVMALAGLGTSQWAAAAVLGAGQACHGLAMGMSNSHEMSYRQSLTNDRLQARTNTTMRAFNRGVIVVVAPLAGLLITEIGTRSAIIIAAFIFAVAVAVLLVSPFRTADVGPPAQSDDL
jgi:MFS family permease